ncbi:MAG TPA: hypothetical protein VK423_01745, partial [Thermoplasmata archaeon]|nr:hypothetical protein [Thermoplasmata archaeon]
PSRGCGEVRPPQHRPTQAGPFRWASARGLGGDYSYIFPAYEPNRRRGAHRRWAGTLVVRTKGL